MAEAGSPSHLERVLRDAQTILKSLGREFALIGGLAVSAHSEPRFTRDVDLAVQTADDRDAEALLRALQTAGYRVLIVLEQETTGRLATVRLEPPGMAEHGVILDLLFSSTGIESEIVRHASVIEVFPDLEVPVAGVGELLAMKVLARDDQRRPQDAADLRALLGGATAGDLEMARRSLSEITARNHHRGRNLARDFEDLLELFQVPTGIGPESEQHSESKVSGTR